MNEDQEMNDHSLHIGKCMCGFLHPIVMGDGTDADVHCPKCNRSTDVYCGTKVAIEQWNNGNIQWWVSPDNCG